MVRPGITVASEPEVLDGLTKAEYFTAPSGRRFLPSLTLHASGWAYGCMITLQMSGQTGREASPSRRFAMGTKQRERLPAFPARSPNLESPTAKTRAADLYSDRSHSLRCGLDYVGNRNGVVRVW